MKLVTVILCHPKEMKQTQVVAEYYRRFGAVSIIQCDFTKAKEEDCRNTAYAKFKDYDYILCVDSDEIICEDDMENLMIDMETNKRDCYQSVFLFYLNYDTVKWPLHGYCPIIAIKPGKVKFTDKRICDKHNAGFVCPPPFITHHLYYIHDQEWRKEQ